LEKPVEHYLLGFVCAVVIITLILAPLVATLLFRSRLRRLESTVAGLESAVRKLGWEILEFRREAAQSQVQPDTVPSAEPECTAAAGEPAALAPEMQPEPAPDGIQPVRADGMGIPTPPSAPPRPVSRPIPRPPDRIESLERVIGTRWLNWVGALVILVGIAFLLKILYDRGWIGPAGRVAIGMGCGVALLYLGEFRLRKAYDLLSQSVSATGSGALFLTTFLAYKFYDFGGATSTFLLLSWFAGFTVALAVIRRGRILAFLGLLGGYLTPYLLSTGEDHAEVLFSYLVLLAAAGAIAHAARGWAGIPALCLALTSIYYIGWHESFYRTERMAVAVAGATGLIVVMGALALARGLSRRRPVRTEETLVLAAAALLGLGYLWDILITEHEAALGFTLCGISLAALLALRVAGRRAAATPMLSGVLLALASGALLLVVPATLKAEGAMLAWALGSVLFADMASRSRQPVLDVATGVCLAASVWVGITEPVSHSGVFLPIINRVFAAWLCAVVAWFVVGVRYGGLREARRQYGSIGTGLKIAAVFMLLGLLSCEAVEWFAGRMRIESADAARLADWRTATLCLLWSLYPALWLRAAKVSPELWHLAAAHYCAIGLGYLSLLGSFHRHEVLGFLNPVFLSALLFPAGIFLVSLRIPQKECRLRNGLQIYGHAICAILLAVELYQGVFLASLPASNREWIRMALISAGWAAYASAVLGIGISRNLKTWRLVALALLGVTILKVFLVDMAAVRQIWRVLSFLVLGTLLMACSYAYSRHERKKNRGDDSSAREMGVSL
jgi:uncharacterized membrane protein